MDESEKKSCASCAFCSQRDQGYSEYTLTGATYDCLLSLNPRFPLDNEEVREAAQAEILEYADKCGAFFTGQRLCIGMGGKEETRQEAIDWTQQFRALSSSSTANAKDER